MKNDELKRMNFIICQIVKLGYKMPDIPYTRKVVKTAFTSSPYLLSSDNQSDTGEGSGDLPSPISLDKLAADNCLLIVYIQVKGVKARIGVKFMV